MGRIHVQVLPLTTDSSSVRAFASLEGLDRAVYGATPSVTELVTALTSIFGREAAERLVRGVAKLSASELAGDA